MNKFAKKMMKTMAAVLLLFFLMPGRLLADAACTPMEIRNDELKFYLFVKGIDGDVEAVDALAGNVPFKTVKSEKLSDCGALIKTLILIDNSFSIPEKNRESINTAVQELMAARSDNEVFKIATFDTEYRPVTEYSDDYVQLKSALDGISYQDQDTGLTDVLYKLFSGEELSSEPENYQRILIISDGVDDRADGYTKEELNSIIEENTVPIYCIGVFNGSGSNQEELDNMFALSRKTGGSAWMLGDLEDSNAFLSGMSEDRDIVRFFMEPDAASLDGGEKTVTLNIKTNTGENEVSVNHVDFPVMAIEQTEEKEEESTKETIELETETESSEESGGTNLFLWIIIGAAVAGAIVALIVIVVVLGKKKKPQTAVARLAVDETRMISQAQRQNMNPTSKERGSFSGMQNGSNETVIINDFDNRFNKGNHSMGPLDTRIELVDKKNPARTWQCMTASSVMVGRSKGCQIVIDNDGAISREHCVIKAEQGRFFITDNNSTGGTAVNGMAIFSKTEIHNGDVIRIGSTELIFKGK